MPKSCDCFSAETIRVMHNLIEQSVAEQKEYGSTIEDCSLKDIVAGEKNKVSLPLYNSTYHTHPGQHKDPSAADIRLAILGQKEWFCIGTPDKEVRCFIERSDNYHQSMKQRMFDLEKDIVAYWRKMHAKYGDVSTKGTITSPADLEEGHRLLQKRLSLSQESIHNIPELFDICTVPATQSEEELSKEIAAKIPSKLRPLAEEAMKYDTYDEFETAFLRQIKHGRYYHVTDNPNFTIDPLTGPRDMSSMAGQAIPEKGKLMTTSDLDYWAEEYKGTRQFVAIIDMSQVPKEKYWQVNRGFGNEFWVDDPSMAKVIKVVPMKEAKVDARLHYNALPRSKEELKAFYNQIKQLAAATSTSYTEEGEESKPVIPQVIGQPYLEKYRGLAKKYPERIDKHIERAKDEKASLVLGRGFGETFEAYLEQNPGVKKRWEELTVAIKEMQQLKMGIMPTIPQAKAGMPVAKEIAAKVPMVTTIIATHVTSNPDNVIKVLKSGANIGETRAEGLVGDLGTSGLYFSETPQLWVGRATAKYDFLNTLNPSQKNKLIDKILSRIAEEKNTGYIANFEYEIAVRDLGYIKSGDYNISVLAQYAGQPYNIRFWEQSFLNDIGAKQAKPPIVVPIKLEGKFADVSAYRGNLSELMEKLKAERYDGAFLKGDIAREPQGVVWNNQAIKQFGEYKSEVAIPKAEAGTPIAKEPWQMTLYRGMAYPYDASKAKDFDIVVWWTPSRQRALAYAGRGDESTLLVTNLPQNLRLLDATDLSTLPSDAPIEDLQQSDSFSTGHNEPIENYLRDNNYDGLIWKEYGTRTIGLLPEANRKLTIKSRLWWQESHRNIIVQKGEAAEVLKDYPDLRRSIK